MSNDTELSDMAKQNDEESTEAWSDTPDEMTEQIEASFGPMTVYVSGTNTDDVQDTFDHVWDRMMETSETMRERKQNQSDDDPSGPAFGD